MIRTYTLDEILAKPFCVFKPTWVGTDSQEDRAALRDSYLRGSAALYGTDTSPPRLMAAPIIRALPAYTADGEVLEEPELDMADAPPAPAPETPAVPHTATDASADAAPAEQPEADPVAVVPFGRLAGTP